MKISYMIMPSPVGKLVLAGDGTNITHVLFFGSKHFESVPGEWVKAESSLLLKKAHKQLDEYFAGKRKKFALPLCAIGKITALQKKVWAALEDLPYGKTLTYRELAESIGKRSAVRAVATAVGKNPLCIVVPCHRVVPASGGVGQYAGGATHKKSLLLIEGVSVA